MRRCKICGCEIEDADFLIEGAAIINKGMESEHALCHSCLVRMLDDGVVIQCDICGENYTANVLCDEKINGYSFTECPACGRDIVDGFTREAFIKEYRPHRYAVTVRYNNSLRGYIVSVDVREYGVSTVVKKLAEKVNLSGAMEITIAEILLEEDEF